MMCCFEVIIKSEVLYYDVYFQRVGGALSHSGPDSLAHLYTRVRRPGGCC